MTLEESLQLFGYELREFNNNLREVKQYVVNLTYLFNVSQSLTQISTTLRDIANQQEDKFVLNVHQVLHDAIAKLELENRRLKEQLTETTEQSTHGAGP